MATWRTNGHVDQAAGYVTWIAYLEATERVSWWDIWDPTLVTRWPIILYYYYNYKYDIIDLLVRPS